MENGVDEASTQDVRQPKRARRMPRVAAQASKATRYARPNSPGMRALVSGEKCSACDQHHLTNSGDPACTGHKRNSNPKQPCTNNPMDNTTVCRMHGGQSPHVQAKAEVRRLYHNVEGQVAELLRECDLPDQHPIDGLLEVVRHTGSMMRLLGSLVAALDLKPTTELVHDEDNAVSLATTRVGVYGYNHLGDQAPHVLVVLYGQWQDRYARACKLALDANIDERLVRNAEATSGALFTAVEKALDAAQMDHEQLARFSKTLAEQIRLLVDPFNQQAQEA